MQAGKTWYPDASLLAESLATMAKTGRNDPCPRGSGNKYKKCCQDKDKAVPQAKAGPYGLNTEIARQANAVATLVGAGVLGDAELPSSVAGYHCLGLVHEARGENQRAADCYRAALDIVRQVPGLCMDFEDTYTDLVNRFDAVAYQ